jgi:hypothetical protein
MYCPDRSLIVRFKKDDETTYKVLGGWRGGYLDGDSWRLNRGIENIKEEGDYYLLKGLSGSVYKCHKKSYGSTLVMPFIFDEEEKNKDIIKVFKNYDEFKVDYES